MLFRSAFKIYHTVALFNKRLSGYVSALAVSNESPYTVAYTKG